MLAFGDDDSVRRALTVCYQLLKHQSVFDCLVVTSDHLEAQLEAQVICEENRTRAHARGWWVGGGWGGEGGGFDLT